MSFEQHHRTFLSLPMCLAIYNEDERYQNHPGGPPNRKQKIMSDPLFKYHVQSCPRYPQRAPGLPVDRQYAALMVRNDGSLEPLVIIPKRDQRFASVATQWERTNSVLCAGTAFNPVVNAWMEVTGHTANTSAFRLIHPEGIDFKTIEEYIANDVELHLWNHHVFDPSSNEFKNVGVQLPEGWVEFRKTNTWEGGIDVMVLPNGKVVDAKGHKFAKNNGHAIPVMSPLDFWSPGTRLVAGAIRGLTNRVGSAASAGFKLLSRPTKALAELSAKRVAGKTLIGMAVPTGSLPIKHLGRRTIIMGEDMAKMQRAFASSKVESGFYDVVIHGDDFGFYVWMKTIPHPNDPKKMKEIWKEVSVHEVAGIIRPRLAPGDQIRLLACRTGTTGGPAQRLANELNHKVWAANQEIWNKQGVFIRQNGKVERVKGVVNDDVIKGDVKSFVPKHGGKFSEFLPQRGTATLPGNGGRATANEVRGVILPKRKN
ncbi:MAG: hypothetical protein AB7Q37_15310 [Pyrinomonadaceae bacterium]